MNNLFDEVILALKQAASEFGSIRKLAEASSVAPENVSRWIAGTRNPSLKELTRVLEVMGAKFVFKENPSASCTSTIQSEDETDFKVKIEILKADLNTRDGQIKELLRQNAELLEKLLKNGQPITAKPELDPAFSTDERKQGAA